MRGNPILQARFTAAMTKLRSGNALDALRDFEAIIATDPNVPEAHFQAGQILLQSRQQKRAIEHFDKARALAPKEPAIWQASLVALGAIGDAARLKSFEKEVRKSNLPDPVRKALLDRLNKPQGSEWGGAPKAEVDALVQALVARDGAAAMQRASTLSMRFPNVGLITNALATANELLGNQDAADVLYRRAIIQAPFDVSIRMNYGRFLNGTDREVGAAAQFRRAAELKKDDPRILLSLASACLESGSPLEAQDSADKVLAMKPGDASATFLKSKALANLNRTDEALTLIEAVLKIAPDDPASLIEYGTQLEYLGRFADAEAAFLKAVDLDPNRGAAYREISMIRKFKDGDPLFDRLLKEVDNPERPASARTSINFALGKMYEDVKNYDRAFAYLKAANDLDAEQFPFNKDDASARYAALRSLRDEIDLPALAAENPREESPIFVSGMPRSGTTLTDRIIAAHSATTSVGEARWWNAALANFWSRRNDPTERKTDLASLIRGIGDDFFAMAREEHKGTGRILDKGLMKQESLGLLLAAIPKAKVVILRRDPRDNLLSIYKNPFNSRVVTFNNDFDALAFTYANFLTFIDFWSEVFPGRIHQLDYDRLTSHPEETVRDLLEFCELDWEDDVMNFHEKDGAVKTLSAFQARQPIYKSSVQSWKRYEEGLTPLFEKLSEYGVLPEDA